MMKNLNTKNLVTAAVCLALCLVLPFLTGQIPQIGSALSPMHIPVLLAGFLCGPWWAMAVGAVVPLLRFFLFHKPPLYPTGLAMCFELAAYGLVSGLLYRALPKRVGNIYVSLLTAMLAGRVVWGVARVILSGVSGEPFTWEMFMAGAFLKAIPGIVVHIALIPLLVMALKRAGFLGRTAPLPA
jgi:thiamine transporter ThiT